MKIKEVTDHFVHQISLDVRQEGDSVSPEVLLWQTQRFHMWILCVLYIRNSSSVQLDLLISSFGVRQLGRLTDFT